MPPGSGQNGVIYGWHPSVFPCGPWGHLPFPIGVGAGGGQTRSLPSSGRTSEHPRVQVMSWEVHPVTPRIEH